MIQFGYHPSWSTWSAHSTSSGCSPQSATCALVMKKGSKKGPKNPKKIHCFSKKEGNLEGIYRDLRPRIFSIHPWKLTCPLKRDYFNRKYIFQPLIFRGHVSFQGCRPTRKPSQQPQKTTKIRSCRVQICTEHQTTQGPGSGRHIFVEAGAALAIWAPEKAANLCHVWAQAKQEVLVNRNLLKVIGVCVYVSTVNSMLQVFSVVLRSVFQSRHKMQTIFILCRSTKNPPFSSQIWSAGNLTNKAKLKHFGKHLAKDASRCGSHLGKQQRVQDWNYIHSIGQKTWKNKTRKVPKRVCLNLFNL